MTLVVCWRTFGTLTVAADTRIADLGASRGINPLTDQGPKIFTTPIIVSNVAGKRTRTRTYPSIGFAYAGGSLIAQSVHAMASICLQNLCGNINKPGPFMKEVANLCRKCAITYLAEMSNLQGKYPSFESFIFGYCPHEQDLRVYHLGTVADDPLDMHLVCYDLPEGSAIHIGSGVHEFVRIVHEHQANGDVYEPFTIFELVLRSKAVQTVGGSRQYAAASKTGVVFRPAMVPTGGVEAPARIEVLGHEITDFGAVGDYAIAHTVLGPAPENRFRFG